MDLQVQDYIALLVAIGGAVTGALAYFNQKKDSESKSFDTLVQNALNIAKQVEPLSKRIDELELENSELRLEIDTFREQKKILEDKVQAMEIAMLESPIYRRFFEFATFPCVVFNPISGEIINANNDLLDKIGKNFRTGTNFFSNIINSDYLRKHLDNKNSMIRDVFMSTGGTVLNGRFAVVYATIDEKPICLVVISVHSSSTMEARVQDLLCQIIGEYESDYATVWSVHKNGVQKFSAVYECAASGNDYLFHNYRDLPVYAYEDMFSAIKKDRYISICVDTTTLSSAKHTLESAGLNTIILCGIFKDGEIVGMLSTSWKNAGNECNRLDIDKLKTYAESNLLQDVMSKFE